MLDKEAILKSFNKMCKNTLMETLAIRFTDIGDDYLVATMPVNSKVHQPYGILHGVKGIEISANHLKSVKEGVVTATAKMIHKGRTTHLWEIRIVNENNELVSLCKLTNIILEKK